MSNKHFVIIIPGLGDGVKKMELATNHWRRYGLEPMVCSMSWRDGEDFKPKLGRLTVLVDNMAKKGYVSVVGTSAGGSAALNTFLERKNRVHKVVNVCGRLRVGTHDGIHSFEARTASSPAFAQSVARLESRLSELTVKDIAKIMTIHPLFGDELVPSDTTTIEEARNITIPTTEHGLSIAMALTLFSGPLIRFLLKP